MATNELIGIELQLKGYDGVMSDLRMLDGMLKGFRGGKNKIEIQNNLAKTKAEIVALRGELNRLREIRNVLSAKGIKSEGLNNKINETTVKLRDAEQAAREFRYALQNFSKMSFKQAFNKISSSVAHIGSAMQSAGNAMTRFYAPFRRFTTGMVYGLGYKALNMLTSGFSGAFERYDTMQNYAKSLEALGLNADKTFKVFKGQEKAMTAIDNLNESVLGLPTGLDEIVASQKMFAGATGEMEKSTKAAIATNNAFLASGMGSREQRFLQRYMVSLASGAELAATQWQSMGRIAPLVMRAVAEELGYAGDKYKQFNADVQDGTISGEQFLDAFIKVGTEGKVQQAANVMKTTWSGLAANLQNATKRMGEGILKTLDEIMVQYNGRNLVQNLLGFDAQGNEVGGGIKHFINDISDAVKEWVKAHPEEILDFINALKGVDWKSLLGGFAEGMLATVRMFESFAKFAGGKDLSWIGRWVMRLGRWGSALTILGGLLKGSRHIIALGGAGMRGLLQGFGGFGLFGAIKRFFGGSRNADKVLKEAPSMMTSLRGAVSSLSGVLTAAGYIAIPAATIWGSVKAIKSVIKDLAEIGDLVGQVDWGTAAMTLEGFGIFVVGFAKLGQIFGQDLAGSIATLKGEAVFGAITALATGIAALDTKLIKSTFGSFRDVTTYLGESIDNLRGLKKLNTDKAGSKIKNLIDTMSQIYASLKVEDEEGKSLMAASGQELHAMKTIIGGMADIIAEMPGISETLKTLKGSKLISGKDAEAVGEKVKGMIDGMLTAFGSFVSEDFGSNPDEVTKEMSNTITNFNNALQTITGKEGLLANMRKLLNATRDISGVQGTSSVMSSVTSWLADDGGLLSQLKEIVKQSVGLTGTDDFAQKMSDLADSFGSLRKAFKRLKGISKTVGKEGIGTGKVPGLESVLSLINRLNTFFQGDSMGQLNVNLMLFSANVNNMLQSIESLSGEHEIDIKVKLKSNKVQGAKEVVSKIRKAHDAILNASNTLNMDIYKTVNVHVSANVDTSGAVGAINAGTAAIKGLADATYGGHHQFGGPVYRAKGGGIAFPGAPRGTDIVPTWLTPGEWVHNKQAVDFFGSNFMRSVNRLDVKGAMRALMARGGSLTSMSRQNTVNNTFNNNQRVTQIIHSNNPNMPKLSLGRYAGAL